MCVKATQHSITSLVYTYGASSAAQHFAGHAGKKWYKKIELQTHQYIYVLMYHNGENLFVEGITHISANIFWSEQ